MRSYNRTQTPIAPAPRHIPQQLPTITPDSQLVNVGTLVQELRSQKGVTYSEAYAHELARSGKWIKGVHWVQPGKQRLFCLHAIYHWIAQQ